MSCPPPKTTELLRLCLQLSQLDDWRPRNDRDLLFNDQLAAFMTFRKSKQQITSRLFSFEVHSCRVDLLQ